ncbi:poly A polymerase C-terminal region-like protein [Viridothelium virens]|uniref:Poly A polymerase C-terminal region-like protein n=1 Tax=Viridothelium virens TaxID=1048519 RepID=A0A6A6HLS4_VIRVR|nr:poly A polymerase C-terminal region-like protein [Viridothelium virens]
MSTPKPEGRSLELTDTESTLRRLLLDVAHYIDSSLSTGEAESHVILPEDLVKSKTILRFTGGWVRDKLLSINSHDIDVAINKMTGYQFGLKMKEYLEIPGNPEKYGLQGIASTDAQSAKAGAGDKSKVVGGLHKIEANPEKSKHLETVTTRVLGLDIDLVNLRKETYTDDSRNPQMEFGTPEEDALRRDATVNAMFYNLNLSEIEDYTGKGFSDMENKFIRTPLEPHQTFKDDPLRVLRLIRFASRLDYTIDSEAEKSMGQQDIKDALRAKISRERVGTEVEKMLKGPRPYFALGLIERLGLYSTIFTDPTHEVDYIPELDRLKPAYSVLESLSQPPKGVQYCIISETIAQNADEEYIALLLAAHIPWVDAPSPEPSKARGKAPTPVPVSIAREGIKATNKICDIIYAAVRNADDIIGLKDRLVERKKYPHRRVEGKDASARDVLGMAIRTWGASWRSQVLWAILAEVSAEPDKQDKILDDYSQFLMEIESLGLYEAYALKPLVDGKTLANALSTKPGPWMKSALDVVMAWQLRNPDRTNPQEAIEEVRLSQENQEQKKGELTKALIHHFLGLTIRPIFAKTQHPTSVTQQGRKRTTEVLQGRFGDHLMDDDSQTKPWKGPDSYALDLLEWVLRSLSDGETERNWGLLLPPLLTIVDDIDHSMKARGCTMLKLLLGHTPPSLLARTGVADVIEEAVMPYLSYLPTLTPEDESIALLSAAYPTLLTLSRVRYLDIDSRRKPQRKTQNRTSEDIFLSTPKDRKIHFLDKIVRQGVLSGFAHASSHVRVAETLFKHLMPLIQELGIEFVKHLKHVLPLITETLSNPFGAAYPPLLIVATKALQTVILNCWPRMAFWRGEVLKGVTICWLRIAEENRSDAQLTAVEKELQKTVQMLAAAVEQDIEIDSEFQQLVAADERLERLFGGGEIEKSAAE